MAPQAQAALSPAEDLQREGARLQRKDTATPDRGFFPGAARGLRWELTTASRRLPAGPSPPSPAGSRGPAAAGLPGAAAPLRVRLPTGPAAGRPHKGGKASDTRRRGGAGLAAGLGLGRLTPLPKSRKCFFGSGRGRFCLPPTPYLDPLEGGLIREVVGDSPGTRRKGSGLQAQAYGWGWKSFGSPLVCFANQT